MVQDVVTREYTINLHKRVCRVMIYDHQFEEGLYVDEYNEYDTSVEVQ